MPSGTDKQTAAPSRQRPVALERGVERVVQVEVPARGRTPVRVTRGVPELASRAQVQRLEASLRDGADPARESVRARQPVAIAPRFQAQLERYYRNLSDQAAPGGAKQ